MTFVSWEAGFHLSFFSAVSHRDWNWTQIFRVRQMRVVVVAAAAVGWSALAAVLAADLATFHLALEHLLAIDFFGSDLK